MPSPLATSSHADRAAGQYLITTLEEEEEEQNPPSYFFLSPLFLSPSFSHPSSPCFSEYSDLHLRRYLSQSVSVSSPMLVSLSICPLFLSLSLPSLFLTFSFSINRMSPGWQLSVNVCMPDVWVYTGVSLVSPV